MSRKLSEALTPRQEGETPTPDLIKRHKRDSCVRDDSRPYGMLRSDGEDRIDLFITAAVTVIVAMCGIVYFAPYIVHWLESR